MLSAAGDQIDIAAIFAVESVDEVAAADDVDACIALDGERIGGGAGVNIEGRGGGENGGGGGSGADGDQFDAGVGRKDGECLAWSG